MRKIFCFSMIALSMGVAAFFITLTRYENPKVNENNMELLPVRIDEQKEYVKRASSIRINPKSIEVDVTIKDKREVNSNESIEVKEIISSNIVKSKYILPVDGEILEEFSNDTFVYSNTLKEWILHKGIDIKSNIGDEVVAIDDGKILDIRFSYQLGNVIEIKHDDFNAVYACVSPKDGIKIGDSVKIGEKIGTVSEECGFELDKEPHLHFEISKDNKLINPKSVIKW